MCDFFTSASGVRNFPGRLLELQNHKALYYRAPNGIFEWQAYSRGAWFEPALPAAFVSNDGAAILDAAYDNLGIALVPEWAVAKELKSGILREIVLSDAVLSVSRKPDLGIYLIYTPPKYSLVKVKAAVEFLVSELSLFT